MASSKRIIVSTPWPELDFHPREPSPSTTRQEEPEVEGPHEPPLKELKRVLGASWSQDGAPFHPLPPAHPRPFLDMYRRTVQEDTDRIARSLYGVVREPGYGFDLHAFLGPSIGIAFYARVVEQVHHFWLLEGGEPGGFGVVGMTNEYTIGVRWYGKRTEELRVVVEALRDRIKTLGVTEIEEPVCVAHDDCVEAGEEMGIACWRERHPQSR